MGKALHSEKRNEFLSLGYLLMRTVTAKKKYLLHIRDD